MAKKMCGFTLIEVMIVTVIVAVLAAIAVPLYENYVLRARRSVAQSFLAQVSLKEEEYFAHMRSYTDIYGTGTNGLGLLDPAETSGFYTYSVCVLTANCPEMTNFPTGGYITIATRVAASRQIKDSVGDLALYSNGRKCTTAVADSKWGNQTC